jgi:hypothetical protein
MAAIRDRAIETNLAKSSVPIANSIACRHSVMTCHPGHGFLKVNVSVAP